MMDKSLKDHIADLRAQYSKCVEDIQFALSIADVFSLPHLYDKQTDLRKEIIYWQDFEDLIKLPHTTWLMDKTATELIVLVTFEQCQVPLLQQIDLWATDTLPMVTNYQTLTFPRIKVATQISRRIELDNPSFLVRGIMYFYLRELANQTGKDIQFLVEMLK